MNTQDTLLPSQAPLSPFDAVARAMDMASLLAGAVAHNQTDKANTYSARLRAHLVRYIYPAEQAQGVPTPDLARALMLADVLACGERGEATMIEAGNMLRSLALAKQAQRALSDDDLARVAYQGYDSYWTENCLGDESEAWASSAKAVLAFCSTASQAELLQQARGVPASMVQTMKDAVEGECDGLAITDAQAQAILANVTAAAPQVERFDWSDYRAITDLPEVDEAIRALLDDQTEDNSTCLVRAIVEAAGERLVQLSAKAEPQPEREPFTADVECVTDESGTDYSVAVRGPGIRNPLYSDVWLKKERQAAMLAKWLNDSVFPTMAGTKGGE